MRRGDHPERRPDEHLRGVLTFRGDPVNKWIGYEDAAKVAKLSLAEEKAIKDVVLEMGFVENGDFTAQQLAPSQPKNPSRLWDHHRQPHSR